MLFTFAVGFIMVIIFIFMVNQVAIAKGVIKEPEAAFPEVPGAYVRGLAKFLGPDGGNIGVSFRSILMACFICSH